MAVMAVPVMAAVGMAVDYTRINAARTAFQVALDATALMMSKNAATETDAQRQTEATTRSRTPQLPPPTPQPADLN
jgi:Flp pilus assembly protein TadG